MSVRRLFALLFVIALFAMAARETLDPDLWWHLRTGEAIWESGIPRQDIFSFTVPDHEWITHEWLSEAIMWGVYQVGGLPGLMVAFAALIALTFYLVYMRCPGRPYLAAFVVILAALTSALFWGARPQMFNLLLTAAFLLILDRVRQGQYTPRTLWLLPPLTALWANLHSGYLLGVVLLAVWTVGEVLQNLPQVRNLREVGRPEVRRLALITVICFLAALINPNTYELWIYPFLTLGSAAMQSHIQEWQSPDFHLRYFWFFAALMGLGVVSWLVSQERPTWSEFLLFSGTAAAGLLSSRHIPLFSLVAAPVICRHLLSGLAGTRFYPIFSGQGRQPPAKRPLVLLNWVLLLLAMVAAAGWIGKKILENDAAIAEHYPVAAVDFLESAGLAETRGYNTYDWGGYLIWRGVPVFVDGRADVYGDDFLFYYLHTYELDEQWREPLDDYDVQYVIIGCKHPLVTLLTASGEWREAYSDELAAVLVRK